MDTYFPDWNNLTGLEFAMPGKKKPFMSENNDLVELLWQNGELLMQCQNNKRPNYDPNNHQQLHPEQENHILNNETISLDDFPIDVCFDKEFCSGFLPQIQSPDPTHVQKNPEKGPNVDHFVPRPQPPPRLESSDARITTSSSRNLQEISLQRSGHREGLEQTIMTVGSNHGASNQIMTNDWTSCDNICSRTFDETRARRMRPGHEVEERDTVLERANTSSSYCSGSSLCKTKTNDRCNDDHTNRLKRKMKDLEESEQHSEATELESASGNKSSQRSGTHRKNRVAEVHNLSERRRRDRINEKMKALQELIPHSTKSDKASLLDEAIEYMKALQSQLQLFWMGSASMAPMMLPFFGPQSLPSMQSLMRFPRLPLVDHHHSLTTMSHQAQMVQTQAHQMFGYYNQMQNSSFNEQFPAAANCIGFHGFQNSQKPTNIFNLKQPGPWNGNGSVL